MEDKKILISGCTGDVGVPLATALAEVNEVWGIARFSDPAVKAELEAAGVRCVSVDLAEPDLTGLPKDFDYLLNFSVGKTADWSKDLDINAGSLFFLMEHCQTAEAVLHCSSAGVYQAQPDHLYVESDPLGDNHRIVEKIEPFAATYSICKIAAEAVARAGARRWQLPTVITRLGVPYSDNGGWPALHFERMLRGKPVIVNRNRPNRWNPIHLDDIVATLPAVLKAADIPPTVINWAGAESSMEEWCRYLGELTGIEPTFLETDEFVAGIPLDTGKLASIAALPSVNFHDGLRRMIQARHPELLKR